jgi:hypothetical protein
MTLEARTRQERIKVLLDAFTKAHDALMLDNKHRLEILIKEDVGSYFTIAEAKGLFRVSVSDIFLWAPDDVMGCLARYIVARCYKAPYRPELWERVKAYLSEKDVVDKGQKAFLKKRSRVLPTSKGRHHDLTEAFKRVKAEYFSGPDCAELGLEGPDRPAVVWSKQRSHCRFGYWMEGYNVIVINRILDSPQVPERVIDYVLYHEVLHKKHGAINLAGVRESHHQVFNLDERRFEGHKEAEAYLQKIYKTRGQCLM